MTTSRVLATARTVPAGFLVAAVAGTVHAGFSLYWSMGGTLLVASVGSELAETFRGREWMLVPVGLVKLLAAVGPVVLARAGWPARRVTRSVCWLEAVVLIVWGGVNSLTANLVLAGVLRPGSDFDRPGMIGHAYLWDPLFLVWGVALAAGLVATRHPACGNESVRSKVDTDRLN